MVKTLISIPEDDKAWLDSYSHATHSSVAAVVRTAIKHYRSATGAREGDSVLQRTAGLWQDRTQDGLDYVTQLRDEWER